MVRYIFNFLGESVWLNGILFKPETETNIALLFLAILFIILESYLIGAINSAIIVSKIFYQEDVRTKGSGNAGTTNIMRNYGKGPAALTLLGDMLKALITMIIGTLVWGINGAYIAGLFTILGHIAPVYYRFKGGKGVATCAMVALFLDLKTFTILIILFVLIVWITKYLSLGSVTCVGIFPLVLYRNDIVLVDRFLRLMISLIIMGIIIYMHRTNIKRIMDGTESKFKFKKTEKRVKKED